MVLAVVAASCGACDASTGDVGSDDDIEFIEAPPDRSSPPYRRVTYFLDPRPECSPIVPGSWEATADAFSAWQEFGVELVESEAPVAASPDTVAVCLRDGEFWSWRYGATAWSPTAGMGMDLRTDIDQPGRHRVLWAIAAHEMLHVVLSTNEHAQEPGLTGLRVCPTCQGFTATDIEWVESFGLTWRGP